VRLSAGIDTWSPCWYLDRDSLAGEMLDQLAVVAAGRGRLLRQVVAGHRVGWHRASGLLYAEGHPCLDGESELVAPSDLPERFARLERAMIEEGIPVPPGTVRPLGPLAEGSPGFGGLRRSDATVDLQLEGRAEGLAVLAGMAAVATTVPRSQTEVRYAKDGSGSVETVNLRGISGVKVLGRCYDKGLESFGPGQRGLRIRIEDQRRFVRGSRRAVEELTAAYVSDKFKQRFYPMWRATKGVTVAAQGVLLGKLGDLVDEEDLLPQQAERLAGFLVLRRRGFKRAGWSQSQRDAYDRLVRDRRKALRELGLVEADGALEEVEVDLHQVLELALESDVWGAEG
jgi:hypothetical protein